MITGAINGLKELPEKILSFVQLNGIVDFGDSVDEIKPIDTIAKPIDTVQSSPSPSPLPSSLSFPSPSPEREEIIKKLVKWFKGHMDVRNPEALAKTYVDKYSSSIVKKAMGNQICISRTKLGELCEYYLKQSKNK